MADLSTEKQRPELKESLSLCGEYGSGGFNEKELRSVTKSMGEGHLEHLINQEAFKILDRDGNGFISADELYKIMADLGEDLTDEELKVMIRVADADGDGRVNREDFVKTMMMASE
mmetsp:Transcript_47562/g.74151  ORF Transcript_47562/g.74151 Transcript_47562/m.74151 type:complete len:116 (-) Transcript_47562:216-563(-)